jgi:hypothetical protein
MQSGNPHEGTGSGVFRRWVSGCYWNFLSPERYIAILSSFLLHLQDLLKSCEWWLPVLCLPKQSRDSREWSPYLVEEKVFSFINHYDSLLTTSVVTRLVHAKKPQTLISKTPTPTSKFDMLVTGSIRFNCCLTARLTISSNFSA